MFGVALDLKVADFRAVLTMPKPVLIGLVGQFLLLPAFTFVLVLLIRPAPSIALGHDAGGGLSRRQHLQLPHPLREGQHGAVDHDDRDLHRGRDRDDAVQPLVLGRTESGTSEAILKVVALDPLEMLLAVFLLLGLPHDRRHVGRHTGFPAFAERARKPIKIFSLRRLRALRGRRTRGQLALLPSTYVGFVVFAVFLHNALALATGYFAAQRCRPRPSATGARSRSRSASRTRRWA